MLRTSISAEPYGVSCIVAYTAVVVAYRTDVTDGMVRPAERSLHVAPRSVVATIAPAAFVLWLDHPGPTWATTRRLPAQVQSLRG
jgi:hypothetical protein